MELSPAANDPATTYIGFFYHMKPVVLQAKHTNKLRFLETTMCNILKIDKSISNIGIYDVHKFINSNLCSRFEISVHLV